MKIVQAKPPYKFGVRRYLTAKDLGITVNKPEKQAEEPAPEAPKQEEEVKIEEITTEEVAPAPQIEEIKAEDAPEAAQDASTTEDKDTLADVGFSLASRRALKKNDIDTIEELNAFLAAGKTIDDLENVTEKTREKLEAELNAFTSK